ncbi:MAG: BON domain-containing protein [Arenimonas sp.]
MRNNRSNSCFALTGVFLVSLAISVTGTPFAMADQEAKDNKTTTYEESETPVTDSWITTKVKAEFLADEDIKGLDINVSTTNGVVTLAGLLDSQGLVDKAVKMAKAVRGVKNVDSTTLTVKPVK